MNRWLQSRLFACSRCAERYLHDQAYRHNLFTCPMRPAVLRQRLLETGRRYEPITERDGR